MTREELVEKYDRDLRLAKNQRDKALHYIEQAREDLQEAERALSMWTTALEDSNGSIELLVATLNELGVEADEW